MNTGLELTRIVAWVGVVIFVCTTAVSCQENYYAYSIEAIKTAQVTKLNGECVRVIDVQAQTVE